MATKKTTRKRAATKKLKKEEVVMWVRLPRPIDIKALKKLGLEGAACFGGDTCIAATSMRPDAGIVLQTDIEQALQRARLPRRPDICFGGDTCIV